MSLQQDSYFRNLKNPGKGVAQLNRQSLRKNIGLNGDEIRRLMQDRKRWREQIMSPPSG